MCAGIPVRYEQPVREEIAASVCGYTGTLWANSHGGGSGECARVHRYTMGKQPGRRMRRVCKGTPVHYGQIVREEDAASVCGYIGTLWANSQGPATDSLHGAQLAHQLVHWYTMSKQSGDKSSHAADSLHGAQLAHCQVHWYTMSKQSGYKSSAATDSLHGAQLAHSQVHWYTMSKQSGYKSSPATDSLHGATSAHQLVHVAAESGHQGPTFVHVRAQLEHNRDTFLG